MGQTIERPILAVGSDWLKALVVNDFATLLGLAEICKSKEASKNSYYPT